MLGSGRGGRPGRANALVNPDGRLPRRIGGWTARLLGLLPEWQARAIQRRRLASLDDRMLKDIGLNRADVLREVCKPFWRA